MNYLNEIYKRLNLTMSFGVEMTSSKKMDVTISSKNLKRIFPLYLLFSGVMTLLLVAVNLKEDLSNIKNFLLVAAIVFIICTTYGLIKYLILFKAKEPKPTNINLYNRELPAKLTPAHVRILLNDGLIDKETIAATILDLIDRGYLKIETEERENIFKEDLKNI